MTDHPANPPSAAQRPKMRRPNRLRGPDAPEPIARQPSGFVPKLLGEILRREERDALPEAAQDLFVQAYNYGLEEYGDPRRALHLAWVAIQRHYDKVGATWVAKPAGPVVPSGPHEDPIASIADRLRKLHGRS